MYTAPATRKAAAAQRRPRAPQLLHEALCNVPAACHTKGSRGPAAATRAAPPGDSVYCACHTKGSRGPAAAARAAARPGGSWMLCVLRLPQERQRRPRAPQLGQEALSPAPATPKAAAAQRRPCAPQLLLEALCTEVELW